MDSAMWNTFIQYGLQFVTVVGVIKIIFNDLAHLAKDLTEIKKEQIEGRKEVSNLGERIAKIEGRCLERAEKPRTRRR